MYFIPHKFQKQMLITKSCINVQLTRTKTPVKNKIQEDDILQQKKKKKHPTSNKKSPKHVPNNKSQNRCKQSNQGMMYDMRRLDMCILKYTHEAIEKSSRGFS